MLQECAGTGRGTRAANCGTNATTAHVGTIEKKYDRDFGVRSDMQLGTLLKQTGKKSLNDLIESRVGRKK